MFSPHIVACLNEIEAPALVGRWAQGKSPPAKGSVSRTTSPPNSTDAALERPLFAPASDSFLTPHVLQALRAKYTSLLKAKGGVDEVLLANSKAEEQLRVLLLFFSDQGLLEEASSYQRNQFVRKLSVYNLVDLGEPYLKWKFAHIAWASLGQTKDELPRPSWAAADDRSDFLIGGVVYRFTRRMIIDRNVDFGQNISQLKKGMPVVSDSFVNASLAKTVVALTSDHSCVVNAADLEDEAWAEGPLPDIRFREQTLIDQCTRTAKELYPAAGRRWSKKQACMVDTPSWYRPMPVYTPSISGHFYSNRGKTGALGAIVRERKDFESGREPELVEYSVPLPKLRHSPLPTAALPDEQQWICPGSCPRCEDYIAGSRFCGACAWHPSDSTIEIRTNTAYSECVRESLCFDEKFAHCRLNAVRPVGLKEPFKARIITGGPEGKYYRCKYIQKATHSHLRRIKNAALIGETLSAERLDEVLWHPTPDQFYVSGDYSAATDNLNPRLSEAVARAISSTAGWNEKWEQLYVEALTGHRIYTGRGKPPTDEATLLAASKPQAWGQLMGSPLSFPVLCIVNIALTRHALELRSGHQIAIRDSGILINGDDIGFVTDDQGYELWKSATSAGGLSPSPGKNFCSRDFIVLNSTHHNIVERAGPQGPVREFEYRPYINYGLLNCRNENGTPIQDPALACVPSGDPRTPDIGALAHDLIKGHPLKLQLVLLKRFIASWKPHLDKFCPRGMSYFAPKHLGGLGLPMIGDFKSSSGRERFSHAQRVMATFLSHDPERQVQLVSTTHISRSESLSLWKKVAPVVDRLMDKIDYKWTKEKRKVRASGALTSTLLASAYADLDEDDVAETESTDGENRYRAWRTSYEALFKGIERSTFAPMSDLDMAADLPWRKEYENYVVVDHSPLVDLRIAPSRLIDPDEARLTLVSEDADDDDLEEDHDITLTAHGGGDAMEDV